MTVFLGSTAFPGNLSGNYVFGLNGSHHNQTMHEKEYSTLCSVESAKENSSICNKGGLGISLSTPILMLSFGVLGNMIALIVLFTAKKEMKSTVFYSLLFGLGVTDLIGQLLTGPIAIIVYANNLQWVGGEPVCKYHAFCMIFFGMITPLFVCAMSFERLLALRFAYFHARVVTRKKAKIVILICWIFVLTFCSLPFTGFGSYEHQFPGSWCFLNFHRESTTDMAYAYTYAFLNISFIIVIIVCNSVVMLTLIKMRRSRVLNNSPSIERRHGVRPRSKMKFEEETQMVWFLCAITLVFSTCYLPLNINILINQITGRINYAADLIGVRMASINQILDPWLYILLRKRVIVKVVMNVANFILCRKKISPKRNRYVHSTSQGSNSYTNYRNGNACQELKHFDSYTNVRETANENIANEIDKPVDKTIHISPSEIDNHVNKSVRVVHADQDLSDSSTNSTTNLISTDDEIPKDFQRKPRLRRSWSLDENLNTTQREPHSTCSDSAKCEDSDRNIRLRKSSLQSFLRVIQWKTNSRKPSLPAKLHTV